MRVWKIIIVPLLILVLAITTACNPFASKQGGEIQQAEVVRGDLIVKVNGSGKTAVSTDAKLAFGTGGKIEKLHVKKGDRVTKGTVLAKLETDNLELAVLQAETAEAQARVAQAQAQTAVAQAQTAVAQAEATLETARFDLDRMKEVDDIKDKITVAEQRITIAQEGMKAASSVNAPTTNYWQMQLSSAAKDKADAQKELADLLGTERFKSLKVNSLTVNEAMVKQRQVEAAELSVVQARNSIEYTKNNIESVKKALEVAEKQLKDATITAPFDGVVATLDVKEGDIVPAPTLAQRPIIYLIDPTTMELNIGVNELDVPKVKIGQKAVIRLDAFPDVKLEGKVTAISPVADVQSRVVNYEVKVAFAVPPATEIRVGMSGTAEIAVK